MRSRVLLALGIGYVTSVAIVALVRAVTGVPRAAALASTPLDVAHGRVWPLVTSAFVVNGPAVPELAGLAIVGGLVIRLHGPDMFWRAVLLGHFAASLIAYAGLGLLALCGAHPTHRVLTAPDYGVSCVWAGLSGALAASLAVAVRHRRNRLAKGAVLGGCLATVALALLLGSSLVRIEHLLALMLGGGVVFASRA